MIFDVIVDLIEDCFNLVLGVEFFGFFFELFCNFFDLRVVVFDVGVGCEEFLSLLIE